MVRGAHLSGSLSFLVSNRLGRRRLRLDARSWEGLQLDEVIILCTVAGVAVGRHLRYQKITPQPRPRQPRGGESAAHRPSSRAG